MLEIAIMIEAQNGLTWPRWQRLARAVEKLGFVGLYRSDHFTNAGAPDKESLELWSSLTWLASHTERLEFGPLVTPVSFRHPVWSARFAREVDDLSGGRLTLGVGAGWQEREHEMFGFELLETGPRMDRFEEGLEIVHRLLHEEERLTFDGAYYQLREAILLPRPARPIPLLVGGNGRQRTLPLAARFADEWNAVFLAPEPLRELNQRLDELLVAQGREPGAVRRSMMTGLQFGRDEAELQRRLEAQGQQAEQLRARGVVVGTPETIGPQLEAIRAAGAQRLMLQWLDLDDLDGLAALAEATVGR